MTIFFIVYGLAGVALHKASREAGDGRKFLYFPAFPFHTALVPLVVTPGNGTKDLLNNKGFWALLAVGLTAFFATDRTLRADPFDAFVMAMISVGILKGFHYCFKECFGI
jgi:hypothetical protein